MDNDHIVAGFAEGSEDGLGLRLTRVEGLEGGLLVEVEGYIGSRSADHFQRSIAKAIEAGCIRLVFDLERLKYSGSPGMGSFTAFLKAVRPRGGDLAMFNVPPKVYEVFRLLGFSSFFMIVDSYAAALDFFREQPAPAGAVFPTSFRCPICDHRQKASKPRRLRCSECGTTLAIDGAGQVFLAGEGEKA